MTRRARIGRSLLVFSLYATAGTGTAAKADALYTVTNLETGGVTLTTASGGTIAVSPDQALTAN